MRLRIPIFCIFLLTIFSIPVYAADETYYIFQIEYAIEDEQILAYVEPIYEAAGLYRTSDFSVIQSFASEGTLIAYAFDADISLLGLQDDVEALQDEDWSRAMLGVDYASSHGIFGAGVRVALIDSGIREDFSELTGAAVAQGVNYLASADSEDRTDTSDSVGHGTFVAGIIASDTVGLAPQAELIPLRCFDTEKSSISYVISAIYDAVDEYHCDVLNLSLGTTTDNPFLRLAVDYAYENGIIMVASSGNLAKGRVSTGNDAVYYPAAYDEVISVGAVDSEKKIAPFSIQNQGVWIVAPGVSVTSLSHTGTRHISGSGTSYAAPYVTAAAALALEADPTITPARFAELLKDTAEDLGGAGLDNAYGYGILNIGLLLAKARNDSDTLILSAYQNKLCVSTLIPALDADFQLLLALYENDGRMVGIQYIFEGTGDGILTNYELPDEHLPFTIFTIERDSFLPLATAKKYN